MANIVLTSAVRQNLLSLQSTADLLSQTQNRLATGNKVNSALDNPTNYFTAQNLNSRASDINNLLDSIGNGVQVIQAANTGITSLQSLVDTAKSLANQALQANTGYSPKSTANTQAIVGGGTANQVVASADNLMPADTAASLTGASVTSLAIGGTLTAAAGGGFVNGDSFTINGQTFNFVTGGTSATAATYIDIPNNAITVNLSYSNNNDGTATATTMADLQSAIQGVLGTSSTFNIAANKATLQAAATDFTTDIALSGPALSKLGLSAGTTEGKSTKSGQQLTIGSIDGSVGRTITFGTGTGQVHTLDQLNQALQGSNLTASISAQGILSFTTTNDEASFDLSDPTNSTIFSGTAVGAGKLLGSLSKTAPVQDANSQNLRASLVSQYNTVMDQITTTMQDASFNGINLLNGDQLKMVFNETGKSTLTISGVNDDPTGLGLKKLVSGVDFIDNAHTNKVLTALTNASATLRTQASSLGANLSVVQVRQDFNKNLINVLQTGASNLTLADTNEEAANSQALATRQSIAVSALALANQSNQSVLRLLQ